MRAARVSLVVRARRQTTLSILILVMTLAAAGQTPSRLAEIRTELEHVKAESPGPSETRGASPRLTTIKHELRDWIESQISQLASDPNGGDGAERLLAARLNAELRQEHLLWEGGDSAGDSASSSVGYLGKVQLRYQQRQTFLVLKTAVEVDCGFDESAYLYRQENGRWNRVWETEQNTYTKEEYTVQRIHAILVSPNLNQTSPYFVLSLGTEPWCSSNWHDVYVRLWSLSPLDPRPKLLLDKSEWGFLGRHDIPVQGSVGRNEALIEYTIASIDGSLLTREAILHYSLTQDKAERIDPFALSPRDFVEEWLAEPWEQSRLLSQASSRAALKTAHQDVGRDEFIQPTRHCRSPDLWQVALGSMEGKKAAAYYLVRWRPPYHFTMVQVSPRPLPACTEIDPSVDDGDRTLFPVQDWCE